MESCPRCGNEAENLVAVDAGMKLALTTTGQETNVPPQVCASCYEQFSGKISKGVKLRAEKKAREQNRILMWKNRVKLIKQARQLMEQKAYSEAAVSYEKYIRVLEVVYELKAGELSPAIFNNSTRSKEMTIIASVYWDLLRIYDTSSTYGERMNRVSGKLIQFAPYSSVLPALIKNAESFARSAKNPAPVKSFLKAVGRGGRCFVASAAYNSESDPVVVGLRRFRDLHLKQRPLGRKFILFYYRRSPGWASWLNKHPSLKPLCRWALKGIARCVDQI